MIEPEVTSAIAPAASGRGLETAGKHETGGTARRNSQAVSGEYIQFGCGLCAPPGWRNFDAGPSFRLQQLFPFLRAALVRLGYPDYPRNVEYADVVRGLPVNPGSANAVYCSHVLEHLALDEFRIAIRNVYGYLRPGGFFRLVVPDLEYLAKTYVADNDAQAASHFMMEARLGEERIPRGLSGFARRALGRTWHLWMWDYKGMAKELADAGFVNIRRAQIGDSAEPRFAELEDPLRWDKCLGVECRSS
jgi:predicted SAM-dependent methyltransferase